MPGFLKRSLSRGLRFATVGAYVASAAVLGLGYAGSLGLLTYASPKAVANVDAMLARASQVYDAKPQAMGENASRAMMELMKRGPAVPAREALQSYIDANPKVGRP